MMVAKQTIQAIDINQLFEVLQDEVRKTVKTELQNLNAKPAKELLTPREVAEEFGMTESYWRKQIFIRAIPFVKMGKAVRLKRKDIEAFIEDNEVA